MKRDGSWKVKSEIHGTGIASPHMRWGKSVFSQCLVFLLAQGFRKE